MPPEPMDGEPLLPASGKEYEESVDLARRRNRYLDMAICVAAPWVCFTALLLLFTLLRDWKFLVWLFVTVTSTGAIIFMCLGGAARHGAFLFLGTLTFASVCVGVILGLHIDSEYLQYYRTVHDGVTYKDVDPSGQAASKSDAGVLYFAPGTLVDDRRTIGFVSDGIIYCVAPVGKETVYSKMVEYWATGTECCNKRSRFNCGTAMASNGRTAIVSKSSENLESAVAEANSVYGLKSAPEALFVSFVDKPMEAADDIWEDCVYTVLVAVCVHLCAILVMVILVYEAVPKAMAPKTADKFVAYYVMGHKNA